MLKNVIQLEHKIADKIITLTCAADTQIDHVKDALVKFLQYCGQIEDQVKTHQAAEKEKADASLPKTDEAVGMDPKPAE